MMAKLNTYRFQLQIDVIQGGFLLQYPHKEEGTPQINFGGETPYVQYHEIFTSQQKLSKKIKEVLDEITSEDEAPQ